MVDAPNTSQYLLALADIGDLPNSLVLIPDVPNGIQFVNSGPGTTLQITTPTGSNLRQLQTLDLSGILSFNTSGNTFSARTISGDGTTISVANGTGVSGNPTISTIAGGSVQLTQIAYNGELQSTRPTINFSATGLTAVTVQDDVGTNSCNVIIGSSGGGGGAVSSVALTSTYFGITPTGVQTGAVSINVDPPFPQYYTIDEAIYMGTGAGFTDRIDGSSGSCVGIGLNTLYSQSGNGNVGFGGFSGYHYVGVGGTFIGANSDAVDNSPINGSMALGYKTIVGGSRCVNISGYDDTAPGIPGAYVGINQVSPKRALHVSGRSDDSNAAIAIDNSILAPSQIVGLGQLYVASSTSTNADQLWFQPGVGSAINLTSGGGSGLTSVGITNTSGFTANGLTVAGSPLTANGNITLDIPFPVRNGGGGGNVCLGDSAGLNLTTAINNVLAGINAGYNITTGNNNIIFGLNAGSTLTTNVNTIAIGPSALQVLPSGFNNTIAIGANSFRLMTSGSDSNIAIGASAGALRTSYSNCFFLGASADAGINGLVGSGAIGYNATVSASNAINIGNGINLGINQASPGSSLHVGVGNVTGTAAIQIDNTSASVAAPGSGSGMVYVASSTGTNADQLWFQPGVGSAINLTSGGGSGLTSVGITNTSGFTANGLTVAGSPLTANGNITLDIPFPVRNGGSGSICIGTNAGISLISSSANNQIAIGSGALQSLVENISENNIAIGLNALNLMTDGEDGVNIAIGTNAGSSQTSYTNCTFVGNYADATVDSLSNSGAFGSNSQVSASNSINIGSLLFPVNVGINQPSPQQALHVSEGNVAGIAAIQIDSTTAPPTAPGADTAIIYVASSGSTTNADQLWFQPGVGQALVLSSGIIELAWNPNPTSGTGTALNIYVSYNIVGNTITFNFPQVNVTQEFSFAPTITLIGGGKLPSNLFATNNIQIANGYDSISGDSDTANTYYFYLPSSSIINPNIITLQSSLTAGSNTFGDGTYTFYAFTWQLPLSP